MAEDPSAIAGTEPSRHLLSRSEKTLEDLLRALDLLQARMEADETLPSSELSKALVAFGSARHRLNEEMIKHEDRILFAAKRVANAPLDFDDLRCSIGGKLDRIRASLGSGELSEESDG